MRLAQIEGGIVVNVIEVSEERPDWAADWPEAVNAGPGWLWDGQEFSEPVVDAAAELAAWRGKAQCSALQLRRALRQSGLRAAVDAYIAGADDEIQEAWEYATVFNRLDPLVIAAVAIIGTPEQGDDLFRLALTL